MPGTAYGRALWLRVLWLCLACMLLAGGLKLLLSAGSIPYNAKKLFRDDGSFVELLLLALALFWFGLGAALSARLVAASRWPWLVLPLAVIAAGLVEYALVSTALRQSLIDKFVGSPILYRDIVSHGIWGADAAARLPGMIGAGTAAAIERAVRFVALYGFFAVILVWLGAAVDRSGGRLRAIVVCGASALAPFVLFHLVAFDFPASDNLEELIAGYFGVGFSGTDVLAALIALIGLHALYLGRPPTSWRRVAIAAALALLALPVGWVLFRFATTPDITRYGVTYSAADFLLGPDRSNKLSMLALALRWSVLQLALVGIVAVGFRVAARGRA